MGVVRSSDKEILTGFINGSSTGFEEFVSRYENKLYSLCLNLTRNEKDSEGVLRDVFSSAVREIETIIDENINLTHSFFKLAIQHAAERERVYHPEIERGESLRLVRENELYPSDSTAGALNTYVRAAVQSLPYEYRVVYLLHETMGLTISEIAPIIDISEIETRAFLHRARLMVCRYIRKYRPQADSSELLEGVSTPGECALAEKPNFLS